MEDDQDAEAPPEQAFRISINGEPFCETEDLTTLTMAVDQLRRGGRRITLYARANEGPLQWMTADLDAGDQIVIDIVDAGSVTDETPLACSFCSRDITAVSRLIEGRSSSICDLCVTAFGGTLRDGSAPPAGVSLEAAPERSCGFCAKAPPDVHGVIVGSAAAICPECLRTASDLIGSE